MRRKKLHQKIYTHRKLWCLFYAIGGCSRIINWKMHACGCGNVAAWAAKHDVKCECERQKFSTRSLSVRTCESEWLTFTVRFLSKNAFPLLRISLFCTLRRKKKSMRTTNSTCINMNWWNALPHFQFSIHRMFFVEANRMLWLSFVNYLLATKKTSTGQTSERLSIYFILISKVCSMFESLDFGARVCANECTAKSRLTSSKENSERNDNTILLECDHLIASSFDLFVVHVSSAHRYASRRRVYRSIVYVHLRWKDTKGLRRCSKARSWCEWMLTLSANRIGLSELCMLKNVDLVISRLTLTRNWCVLSALTTTNDSSVQFWRWLQSVFICGVRHWVRSGIIYSGLNMLYQPKIGVNRSKS